jgi:8-oxo-dGTP pyrophosphatase MutT (NUDIX family)
MMMKYVAGCCFSSDGERVALIHKEHGPEAVVGRWNAIGGKILTEQNEEANVAMRREFLEETGTDVTAWTLFLVLKGIGWQVSFFHIFSSELLSTVRTAEREVVDVFPVREVLSEVNVVPNLRWIIPMALGHEKDHVLVYEVTEKETF